VQARAAIINQKALKIKHFLIKSDIFIFYEKIDKTIDKLSFWSIFIIGGEDETIENYL